MVKLGEYHQGTLLQNQGTFFNFEKMTGETSLPPPSSYAPDEEEQNCKSEVF